MKKKYNKKISGPLDRIKGKKKGREKKTKKEKKDLTKLGLPTEKLCGLFLFFFSNIHSKEALLNHQV